MTEVMNADGTPHSSMEEQRLMMMVILVWF
jgi:hypothetical protein